MWCNHQRQWYPVFHEQKTLLLYAKLFRLVNKRKMSEKEPKEWRKRRNAKLMRFILPFQWHQTIFFKCSSVYGFVFTIFFFQSVLFTDIICFFISKLTASMRKFCMLARATKCDANNPTYLLDLSTFVTIIVRFIEAAFSA